MAKIQEPSGLLASGMEPDRAASRHGIVPPKERVNQQGNRLQAIMKRHG